MERFDYFSEFTLPVIPDFEMLKSGIIERWDKEAVERDPSFFPKKGDKLILLKPKRGRNVNAYDSLEAIENAGYSFPNSLGLLILENMITEGLIFLTQKHIFILGYDHLSNLPFRFHDGGHKIPYLQIGENENEFFHATLPYKLTFEADELILVFEKA